MSSQFVFKHELVLTNELMGVWMGSNFRVTDLELSVCHGAGAPIWAFHFKRYIDVKESQVLQMDSLGEDFSQETD